jgi:hypothetical protein
MTAQIDNTPTATQKGALLPVFNQPRFERANQSSHAPGNISRNPCRFSYIPKINRHEIPYSAACYVLLRAGSGSSLVTRHSSLATVFHTLGSRASSALIDGHTMPSENAATPAASTKPPKLMDTLFALVALRFDVTSRCNIAVTRHPLFSRFSSFQPQASSGQHLSRYTCRDRNRVNSRGINNITKNFSIHF